MAEHRGGRLDAAIAQYEKLLRGRPDHAGALANLATALKQAGRRDEALSCFRRATALKDVPAETWFNYGNLLVEFGDAAGAERAYRRALSIEPGLYRAQTNLANLLSGLGRNDDAVTLHREAIAAAPNNLPSLRALARLHYERGEASEAEQLYCNALKLKPDHPETLNALGVVLKDLGLTEEAVGCWKKAIAIAPGFSAAHNNLGVMLRLLKKPREAAAHLREAVRLNPRDAMAAANLAHALIDLGQVTEAEALSRSLVTRVPDNADGHLMLGFALAYQGVVEPAIAEFVEAHRLSPQSSPPVSNALFASLYSDQRDAGSLLEFHREMVTKITPAAPVRTAWGNLRDAERRLRIGYLSPDLRQHPVAVFFEPVLSHHDRNAVEVFCYSTTNAPDVVTDRLRGHAAVWRDLPNATDVQIASRIEEDRIDILVDLAGHTAQNRAAVIRAKPAPVQVLYIGYPGTSGMPEVDYVIADDRICPPELERFYAERIVRMPGSFWCFRPPQSAPAVSPLPAAKNGFITFGSYNALQKMSESTVRLWSRVLAAVPGSRLRLMSLTFADERARKVVEQRFEATGLAAGRVAALPPIEPSQFLAEYAHVDIGLDPVPYNGGTTTCEALWMGVPVVTLAGEQFASRMGASLLPNVGLPELVARDADNYVRIAVALAADMSGLAAVRAGLREKTAGSPICDAPRAARELETAYRAMWREWVSHGAQGA